MKLQFDSLIRAARPITSHPRIHRVLEHPRIAHVVWVSLIASLVRQSSAFVARELVLRRNGVSRYDLRQSGLAIHVRHGSLDLPTLDENLYRRQYELPGPVARMLDSLGRPPRVVDLGANVGLFGIFLLERYPDAELTAYEPDRENAGVLRRTIAANGLGRRWELVEAAATTKDGSIPFWSGRNTISRIPDEDDAGADEVPAVDVLPVLAEADFAKIDIEGGEWAILGDARFRDSAPPALVLEYHKFLCPHDNPTDAVVELLEAAGYTVSGVTRAEHEFGIFGLAWAWKPELDAA